MPKNNKPGSIKRRVGFILLALLLSASLWFFWPRHADLRAFSPASAAQIETRMWRSYYEKRRLPLLLDLYRMSRREYGFSPWASTRIAWHAARAAVKFQPTHSRAEAQAALPALEEYFRVIANGSDAKFDPTQAAREELDWWQLRRENKTWQEYAVAVARVTATIYSVDEARVLQAARSRSEAMDDRDRQSGKQMTEADWQSIEGKLLLAWRALKSAVQ